MNNLEIKRYLHKRLNEMKRVISVYENTNLEYVKESAISFIFTTLKLF